MPDALDARLRANFPEVEAGSKDGRFISVDQKKALGVSAKCLLFIPTVPATVFATVLVWCKALKALPTRSGGNRGKGTSASILNRDMTCFRAALNLACLDRLLTTAHAWRSKRRPIKNAGQRRELYFDRNKRLKFIEQSPPDLAKFLRGLCQLPLRPGG